MDLILRSIERMLQTQLSMARRFKRFGGYMPLFLVFIIFGNIYIEWDTMYYSD